MWSSSAVDPSAHAVSTIRSLCCKPKSKCTLGYIIEIQEQDLSWPTQHYYFNLQNCWSRTHSGCALLFSADWRLPWLSAVTCGGRIIRPQVSYWPLVICPADLNWWPPSKSTARLALACHWPWMTAAEFIIFVVLTRQTRSSNRPNAQLRVRCVDIDTW